MRKVAIILAATVLAAASVQASPVNISATGTVVFNGVNGAPLDGVNGGETATVSFTVDSDNFIDGVPGDLRSYVIDPMSFVLSFSGGVSVGLVAAPPDCYFTIVDGFPVSDGFFVSTSIVSPGGVPLEQEPVQFNLDLGYDGSLLQSLDIHEAKGVYGFDLLTRFAFNLWEVFPDNVRMDIDFQQMTIANEPVSVDASSWSKVKSLYR
jgi:hypothetical protein